MSEVDRVQPQARDSKPARAFLALGSNLGDRRGLLTAALDRLEDGGALRVRAQSSLYETAPVGKTDQPWFYNLVIEVETALSPSALLAHCQVVEDALGRRRGEPWGPRTVDIDILLYNDMTVDTATLVIPHPELTRRRFVLEPLLEIAPDARLPDGRPVRAFLARVADQTVRRLAS